MGCFYSDSFLRMIRNEVNIDKVVDLLMLETRSYRDLLRFRCPLCHQFHTATKTETNLARCFDCKINFNPIDLVMKTTSWTFIDSVEFLKKQINTPKPAK